MNGDEWLAETRISYDTVAASYAERMRGALDGAPFLRVGLRLFGDAVREAGGGPVADVGCGPGHVTAHLNTLGINAFGVDLSPAMVDVARRDHPHLTFKVGSMTDLGLADGSLSGLLAFWSLIHVPDDGIPGVLAEFRRVLQSGAPMLIGFHLGDGVRHKTEGYGGYPMNVDVYRRTTQRMTGWLEDAGFAVTAQILVDLDTAMPGAMLFARRNDAQERAN